MVLIERQGECYVDVVCGACAIMWALQHTSVQTVSQRGHGVTRWNPRVAGRLGVAKHSRFVARKDIWLCFCNTKLPTFFAFNCSTDAKLAMCAGGVASAAFFWEGGVLFLWGV